ncbi:TonB-dependent siderophore receptor [Aliivibrio salmonicida]|uniref:TonB dependent receptor n=1 Tax=Aliivibrio salmonicida (strain LFI1238) TaxID=316275 RepID=B6EQ93_ALISL|nr:TonB-dependent siderophore receptor [Aliivibrio salmonicida]AZL86314.1 TonB-dependent siderophore receptor [Aliivibrio salmonicida]CAQ80864.1 TonB dependent receptor [Aliivibrio salmonicida LFI1238]
MFSKSQLALVIGAVLSIPFAYAETDASTTDEHMVVTGRDYGYKADTNSTSMRMEATQLETPGQVTVIDEQIIDEQRASTLGEVLKNDSSISEGSKSTNRERFYLRGFKLSSSSSFLRDGVQHWSHYRQPIELLERVEVMKGPAGLLYGKSTPGGLVNMISKKPTYETQVTISQDIGSNNYTRSIADVSGSLNEDQTLRARVILSQENQDSWRTRFDGTAVETDRTVGGLFVDYDINEDIMLSAHYDRTNEIGDLDNGSKVDTTTGEVIDPNTVKDQNWAKTDNDVANYGVGLTANLTDSWSVKTGISRQYYERQRTESDINKDGSSYKSSDRHDEWTFDTAYVDFMGDVDALGVNHRLLVGGNGLNYDYKRQYDSSKSCITSTDTCSDGFNRPSDLNSSNDTVGPHSKSQHYGIYLQDLVTFNDSWQLLAGARFAVDKTEDSKGKKEDYTNILSKLGVIYHPAENGSIYAVYSESFEPVATINDADDVNDGQKQDPMKGNLYELGSKWELLDNSLYVSGALFQIVQSNMQVSEDINGGSNTRTSQVGEQVHTGIELAATGYLTEAFSLSASTTFLDAKYENDPALEGKTPADVPEFSASIWSQYDFNNGTGINLGVYHVGERYGDSKNEFKKDAYTRVDMGISHTLKYDDSLDFVARFNVENLLDTDYLAGGSASDVVVGEGRNYMATLQVKY